MTIVAAAKEHEDFDSLIVCYLSHGKEGRLYAKDKHFDEKKLWNRFYQCEALIGKPKLFLIQVGQAVCFHVENEAFHLGYAMIF